MKKLFLIITSLLITSGLFAQTGDYKNLFAAIDKGDISAVKKMVNDGTDVDVQDELRNTPLHRAAYFGYEKIVILLISKGADVNSENNAVQTPLHEAVRGKHYQAVKVLLDNGANVNKQYGPEKNTALMMAAQNGDEETVKLLLKHGANIDIKNAKGDKASKLAKDSGYKDLAKMIKKS